MKFIDGLFENLYKENKNELTKVLIFIGVIVFMFSIFIIGLISSIVAKPKLFNINEALNCSADKVVYIEITKEDETVAGLLTKDKVIIKDQHAISKICKTLNVAKAFSPSHPRRKWSCVLKIKTKKDEYFFHIIEGKDRARIGTMIFIHSNVTWGWLRDIYRSDQLGPILQEYAPFLKSNSNQELQRICKTLRVSQTR